MSPKNNISMMAGTKSSSALMANRLIKQKDKKLTKSFVEYAINSKWISQNRTKLRKKFGNEFVAIHNKKVCLHDDDLLRLYNKVSKKYPKNQDSVVIDYIGKRRLNFLL